MDVHLHLTLDDRLVTVAKRAGIAALVAAPVALWAAPITLPNTFTNGTVADANQVNANFTALEDQVNALDAFFEPGAGGSHDVVLGAGVDERLSAAEASTLTGGGSADALHTHAAAAVANPWVAVGQLADYDTVLTTHPRAEYEWAIGYNGDIRPVTVTVWNIGVRIATIEKYPQGDNAGSLTWGHTVFTRGLQGESATNWTQRYWSESSSGQLTVLGSNGVVNTVTIFARLR